MASSLRRAGSFTFRATLPARSRQQQRNQAHTAVIVIAASLVALMSLPKRAPTARATATPVAGISLSPAALQFAAQLVNTPSAPQFASVINPDSTEKPAPVLRITPAGMFSVNLDCPGATLPPQSSCAAQVIFRPARAGLHTALLESVAGDGTVQSVVLRGSGLAASADVRKGRPPDPRPDPPKPPGDEKSPPSTPPPVLTAQFTPAQMNLPQTRANTPTHGALTLRNTGNQPLLDLSIRLRGSQDFSLNDHNCASLAAGAQCQVDVSATPEREGSTESLILAVNEGRELAQAQVRVNALKPAAGSVDIRPNPAEFTDKLRRQTISIRNGGSAPLVIQGAALDSVKDFALKLGDCGRTLAPGETCSLEAGFKGKEPAHAVVTLEIAGVPDESRRLILMANVNKSRKLQIIGGLIAAGAVTAAVLAHGGSGEKSTTPPQPTPPQSTPPVAVPAVPASQPPSQPKIRLRLQKQRVPTPVPLH